MVAFVNAVIHNRPMNNKPKFAVAGLGYVGLGMACLLATQRPVIALDVVPEKVYMVANKISPIEDRDIVAYLKKPGLNLVATTDAKEAYEGADYVIIAVPTNFDESTGLFDTHYVDDAIKSILKYNKLATIVIKSTVPVGYTRSARTKFKYPNIIFSPEFSRESRSLYDNLYPTRIIVGTDMNDGELTESAMEFATCVQKACLKPTAPILVMDTTEAESTKLFANAYLAMRVAFFNELDTFAELKGLNTKNIIDGVCTDERIGDHYNNPSFGYGGYCFPKDTKQLLCNYQNVPNDIVAAIVKSNKTRKQFIADQIIAKTKPDATIGIYRLTMKTGSDNFRQSAIQDIMKMISKSGRKIIIFEPTVKDTKFETYEIENNMEQFKSRSAIIIANRIGDELDDVKKKIYTKDIFKRD